MIPCCTGSWENYFRSVGLQSKNNNPHFKGWQIEKQKNIDHQGKETCA